MKEDNMNPTFTIRTSLGDKMTFTFGTVDDDVYHNRLTVQIINEHGKPMGAPIWKVDYNEIKQFVVDIGTDERLRKAANIIQDFVNSYERTENTVEAYMNGKQFLNQIRKV